MPLTKRGIIYLFVIVAAALGAAFIVIRGLDVRDAWFQYYFLFRMSASL